MISESLQLAKAYDASCVRAITNASCNPFKCWYEATTGEPKLLPISDYNHEVYNAPRQELPRYYWQTGHLDFINVQSFIANNSITGDNVVGLFVDDQYSVDIDTLADFASAEYFLVDFSHLEFVHCCFIRLFCFLTLNSCTSSNGLSWHMLFPVSFTVL